MAGSGQAWTLDLNDELGDKFGDLGDKSNIPENAIIFSISALGEEILECARYFHVTCRPSVGLSIHVHELRRIPTDTPVLGFELHTDRKNGCRYDSDEGTNKSREVFESMNKTNDELERLLREINGCHVQIKKFRNILKEKTDSDSCSSLDIADSAEKFVAEQLHALMKTRFEIHKKMDDLQICVMDEDRILPYDDDYFLALASEIIKNQESISQIIKYLNKNQDVYLFRQMMNNSQTKKSEEKSV
ncbi:hypothetical protein AVEN_226457-1 [Araneus ventricosus]|uniref:Uncharacterized protein n=1 Tax=Araneus ventricosus TaxID=182803 RepID=A0A4Y2NWT3_ARAVE|nr:hypothetical protein AVEN_226457-1 [Araneus ventricosus]